MLVGLIHKAKFLLNDNSSTILTGIGVSGTIATAYLSGRASFKAAQIIEHAEEEYKKDEALLEGVAKDGVTGELSKAYMQLLASRKMSTTTKVRLVWRFYLAPVAVGSTTIVSIVMANRLSSKKIAALAVASGISERALQEYKAKVIEKLGEKQDRTIRDEVAQERVTNHPLNSREIVLAGTGDVLCYDMTTGRYFASSVEDIKRAENKINYQLLHFQSASLSEFYDEIGLPATNYTDSVGWNDTERFEVQFSTTMSSDNRPCIAIDFVHPPQLEYARRYH